MHISKENEVDLIDVAPLVLFPIATGVIFGVFSMSIQVFGGWTPADILFSAIGVDWTYAFLVALLAILAIIGTNEIDGSDYEAWEYAVIAFSFLSPLLWKFVPSFQNTVAGYDIAVFGVWLLTAFAAGYVAYTE